MPRYARLFIENVPLHIVQRGHDRSAVFLCEEGYAYYLANLREARDALEIEVFAYCLMTNHVHLVVMPTGPVHHVSAFMRILAGRQTRYLNRRERRSGTLWEGRFKSSLIDSERYLLACYRYVELNPVRAGMIESPEDYRWSSHRQNAGFCNEVWVDRHPVFAALGGSPAERTLAYRKLVASRARQDEVLLIREALARNQITGGDAFKASVAARVGREVSTRPQGRPPKEAAPGK